MRTGRIAPTLLLIVAGFAAGFVAGYVRPSHPRPSTEPPAEQAVIAPPIAPQPPAVVDGEPLPFLKPVAVGRGLEDRSAVITNVLAVDLDGDGLMDSVACDAGRHSVVWVRQTSLGVFDETTVAEAIIAPAHVAAVDVDADGDLDLLVASLGKLFPSNDPIGVVYVLENRGDGTFTKHIAAEGLRRVSDVRGGDLDGDGDVDLSVAVFGAFQGGACWLENKGGWRFERHDLQNLSGPIHSPIVDIDGDGDNDIALLVSQEWEEIYLFVNDGAGKFTQKLVYGSIQEDFGSSGIEVADLDGDGDLDILYTNGDAWDYNPPVPRPWHGIQWLENVTDEHGGTLRFDYHRLTDFEGCYGATPVDIDHDGDLDILAISMFADWSASPAPPCIVVLENIGDMRFVRRTVSDRFTHLQTVDAADFDGDGRVDFVTGGLHVFEPFDRMSRITVWYNGPIDEEASP